MSRRKRHNRVELEGLVGYVDDDPIAEVSIVTDYGQELLVDPEGPMNSPFQWIDSVVRVWGRFVMRDGRRYLQVDRIHHVNGEPEYGESSDEDYDWDVGDLYSDDTDGEYEDRF